jgi:hypothetical protein
VVIDDVVTKFDYEDTFLANTTSRTFTENDFYKALHESEKTLSQKIYIDDNFDTSAEKKRDLLGKQKNIYSFNLSHFYFNINIGDEITLQTEKVKNGSVDLLVTGYSKSIDLIRVTAMELDI